VESTARYHRRGEHYLGNQRPTRAQRKEPMSKVFVLDTNKQALNPMHPGRARLLLTAGKAVVYRRYPFTIILKRATLEPILHPLRVKIDPGSKTTGIAVVNDANGEVMWAAELTHRGEQIKRALDQRRTVRHSRRQRKTRYRKPRFDNRRKRKGTLAPSLQSRVCNIITWVRRLIGLCPITSISQELVRFDTQVMENPDIEGVEYQQGELAGYEIREFVLVKWNHTCAYCDAQNVPFQLDHVQARSRNGSNRVSNLVLACEPCNQLKGNQDIRTFLKEDPTRRARILAHLKAPLRDTAAVNATRWLLYERLKAFGLLIECGSGGRTKYNRMKRGLAKTHWLDAACVGASTPQYLSIKGIVPLLITATGHGIRQMCRMDRCGFPRTGPKLHKRVQGFQTGDLVRAVVSSGSKQGTYAGKVAVRSSGSFNITTSSGTVQGIQARYCVLVARSDGYTYQTKKERLLPPSA
jgi:5-methylcytosine-specific restriction endonuclease McrA